MTQLKIDSAGIEDAKALIAGCNTIDEMEAIARSIPRVKPLEELYLKKMLKLARDKRERRIVLSHARPTSRFARQVAKTLDPVW